MRQLTTSLGGSTHTSFKGTLTGYVIGVEQYREGVVDMHDEYLCNCATTMEQNRFAVAILRIVCSPLERTKGITPLHIPNYGCITESREWLLVLGRTY